MSAVVTVSPFPVVDPSLPAPPAPSPSAPRPDPSAPSPQPDWDADWEEQAYSD